LPASRAGLARIERLLTELGNPHQAFNSIHIAGTCGKGSTTTMVGAILAAAGYRTGLFRSPHLADYTERVTVGGRDIDRDAWVRHMDRIRPIVDAMRWGRLGNYSLGRPALFEVLFALGSLYLAEQHVDWAVMETGLGGRLDATNTLRPAVSVITNVSLEHTQVLGNTVAEIAREKAGIVKTGVPVVVGTSDPHVLNVVEERASLINAPLIARDLIPRVELRSEDLGGQDVTIHGSTGDVRTRLALAGSFQLANAATAAACIETLAAQVPGLTGGAIARGLSEAILPGRMEVRRGAPTLIFDGAHNPAGMSGLAQALRGLAVGDVITVFATMSDKDVKTMARHLSSITRTVIVTRAPGTERAADPAEVARVCRDEGMVVSIVEDARSALAEAIARAGRDDIVLVTGSLYLVGALRSAEPVAVS